MRNKSGIVSTLVITFVILALLNICTFVIPFNKIDLTVHFIAYGCAEFVILMEMIIVLSQFFTDENPNQKVLSIPIVYFGYIAVIIQILATFVFYLVNAFISLPIWIVIIIECLIIGIGIIQIAKAFFFKSRNKEYHEQNANTKFMDEFRARLKALNSINKNQNIERLLNDLLDIALGSDPVTNDKTIDSENELLSLLLQLDEAIKSGSETECRDIIEKTKIALLERNVLCKAGK